MDETPEGFRPVTGYLKPSQVLDDPAGSFFATADKLLTCEACGVVVTEDSAPLHGDWHAGYKEGVTMDEHETEVDVRPEDFQSEDGMVITEGTELVAKERLRQVNEEGWTPEHDAEHTGGDLIDAAHSYALAAMASYYDDTNVTFADIRAGKPAGDWPWDESWWKPSEDPVRNLVKAGALIIAEIDRLLAQESTAS